MGKALGYLLVPLFTEASKHFYFSAVTTNLTVTTTVLTPLQLQIISMKSKQKILFPCITKDSRKQYSLSIK